MRAIWQDINEFRAATDSKGKRIATAKLTRDVGIFWLDLEEGGVVFGVTSTDEDAIDEAKLYDAVAGMIEDLGGTVPMQSAEVGAGGEVLKILLPILLKLLADRLTRND
jgi:hypothetical protein